jgi:hypothetical protein
MKKLFILMAIAGVMVACKSDEEKAAEALMDAATEAAESFM